MPVYILMVCTCSTSRVYTHHCTIVVHCKVVGGQLVQWLRDRLVVIGLIAVALYSLFLP